ALPSMDESKAASVQYKFAHDRIQEAGLEMLDADAAMAAHYAIGRYLLGSFDATSATDALTFAVADHLHRGTKHVSVDANKRVTELYLLAALAARRAMAYPAAMRYLQNAAECLASVPKEHRGDLLHRKDVMIAETLVVSGKFAETLAHLDKMQHSALPGMQRAAVQLLRCQTYGAVGDIQNAIDAGTHGLGELGINVQMRPSL